jgi:hypothetical protein
VRAAAGVARSRSELIPLLHEVLLLQVGSGAISIVLVSGVDCVGVDVDASREHFLGLFTLNVFVD